MDNSLRLMFPLLLILILILIIIYYFLLLSFILYAIRRRFHNTNSTPPLIPPINTHHHITNHSTPNNNNNNTSLLVEISPPLLEDDQTTNRSDATTAGEDECENKRNKKKRAKKKEETDLVKNQVVEKDNMFEDLYPYISSSGATHRRIKQQYHHLLKSHASNRLTLLEVCQFVNRLSEARNELEHKSEVIHRKFAITKALLFKADKSSFDRLHQQMYKLELELKRLEEDEFVYNSLQQQLKLSPAYQKMLEIGSYMESVEATEDSDVDIPDISFEELLAKEKKDTFWQKKRKLKSGSC